ncbi:hypothetical protein V5E97_13195 [Singulisphaera sp. Ch08]|uniref:Beta-lactamase-inhibitor-like PepSY-like domain-containing protein n=1 Tax=Singulisphaera sp. Ch08 TaxID=3120278 RepID=A0AAU7CPP3_9BACT
MAVTIPNRRRVLFVLASGALAASSQFLGQSTHGASLDDFDLGKVPAKFKAAASEAVPEAKWTSASKSVDDGDVTYELGGVDADKRKVWVTLTGDGKVDEVSYEIAIDKVPQVVTAALKKKMPRFQVSTSYESRKEGKVYWYYFDGKRPRDKEEITASVSPDGKEVELEED